MRPLALMIPVMFILLGVVSNLIGPSGDLRNAASSRERKGKIIIGSKNFTEQLILGEIMAQLIESRTDLLVERRFNLGGTMICHSALLHGEIDLYPEYTGTALTAILNAPVLSDPEEAFRLVKNSYGKRFQIRWLQPFGFNNTYAITVLEADAKKRGWARISDLKSESRDLVAGFTAEFAERPDGYPGLRRAYGLTFGEVKDLDPSLMYDAVLKGQVNVICAFATDGRITAFRLKPLVDDKAFFPPYHAAPVVRDDLLKKYPEIQNVLTLLEDRIHDKMMQDLNYEVDVKNRRITEVAKDFLTKEGLL